MVLCSLVICSASMYETNFKQSKYIYYGVCENPTDISTNSKRKQRSNKFKRKGAI